MELKIIQGNRELEFRALFRQGEIYVPGAALSMNKGLWADQILFLNSPLHKKRICLTVVGPDLCTDQLPGGLEEFVALCNAAGAKVLLHTGGQLPLCDVLVFAELGGANLSVQYMGFGFRSLPLARRLVANLKRGLRLAYLPDPLPFRKPQYNLQFRLWARLTTPGLAILWPAAQTDLSLWLFSSLMEFWGDGSFLDGSQFSPSASPSTVGPATETGYAPAPPSQLTEPAKSNQAAKRNQPEAQDTGTPPAQGQSATMSRAQYGDFFQYLEAQKLPKPVREPFG